MQQQVAGLLFADVVGYSKLKEAQLKTFLAVVLPTFAQEVLERYRQELLELNTWGDGLVVASANIYMLAQVALDIRDFYRNRNWAEVNLPKLSVRIALHAGAVYVGNDPVRQTRGIIGSQVNLTARLEPVVDANEIAVTQQFFSLIPPDQELPFGFDDLGEKALAKDYGRIQAYRLRRGWEQPFSALGQTANTLQPGAGKTAPEPTCTGPSELGVDVDHPLKSKKARGPLSSCQFHIMFPGFRQTGRWHALGDVQVEVTGKLPEWAQEAYLIPSARALPQFRGAAHLKDPEHVSLLDAKKNATIRFVEEWRNRELKGAWFTMPTTKGEAIGVYCLDYDLFLNASLTHTI